MRNGSEVPQHGTAAERSHLRCLSTGGDIRITNRSSIHNPSARAVTAVPTVGRSRSRMPFDKRAAARQTLDSFYGFEG
jgi:hypothetical protein